MRALLLNQQAGKHGRYLNNLAERFCCTSRLSKAMRTLLWYLIHRKEKHDKRAYLYQTVQSVDNAIKMKTCFEQMCRQMQVSQRIIAEESVKRENRMMKTTYLKMKSFAFKSKRLRHCHV
jgi:hypothetical protein